MLPRASRKGPTAVRLPEAKIKEAIMHPDLEKMALEVGGDMGLLVQKLKAQIAEQQLERAKLEAEIAEKQSEKKRLEAEVVEKRLEIKKLEAEVTEKERLHVSTPSRRSTKSSRVGRNDPCPCGSGKKLKHCCIKKHVEL
jgi:uncharacterized protein YecA (UPF0149 family)